MTSLDLNTVLFFNAPMSAKPMGWFMGAPGGNRMVSPFDNNFMLAHIGRNTARAGDATGTHTLDNQDTFLAVLTLRDTL